MAHSWGTRETITGRNRLAALAAAGLLALALAGCSEEPAAPETSTPAPTEATTTTEAAPTTSAEATSPEASEPTAETEVPSRAEMDVSERILAEAYFTEDVRDSGGFDPYDDATLIDAGDAACDSVDRGDSLQSTLIVVAGLLPEASSTDAIAGLAGAAIAYLCPEHAAAYTD